MPSALTASSPRKHPAVCLRCVQEIANQIDFASSFLSLLFSPLRFLTLPMCTYTNILIRLLTRIDSPGVPPSATANELFKGFSYIAPPLLSENMVAIPKQTPHAAPLGGPGAHAVAGVNSQSQSMEVVTAPPLSRVRLYLFH